MDWLTLLDINISEADARVVLIIALIVLVLAGAWYFISHRGPRA